MLPTVQVDRGAIRHILNGSNIMCKGLTSEKAAMDTELEEDVIVAVHAEGKELPLCIGRTAMSTEDIRTINADVGVYNIHHLDDGLWKMYPLE